MKNGNNHNALTEILMSSVLSFIDKVNDIFDKILESKVGFLLITITLIAISAVILIQINK